jgi:hypothetical protein
METQEITISRHCEECTQYIKGQCPGKEGGEVVKYVFGTKHVSRPSGIKFCRDYEFDEDLYIIKGGRTGSIGEIRKRQVERKVKTVKKQIEEEKQVHFDDVELGESLSSSDMAEFL